MITHVIGANGFVGKAIFKRSKNLDNFKYYSSKYTSNTNENYKFFDISDRSTWLNFEFEKEDKIIFLSWRNLPNYNDDFHIYRNLIDSINFLKFCISKSISKIIIAGTCYEYGLQNGKLSEDTCAKPVNCYAAAKNSLRESIESLCKVKKIDFAWLRIFYPYGDGQNPKSLIPSLERAIKRGDNYFPTTNGNQIRDFVSIDFVAEIFLLVAREKEATGIINVGSGNPLSIRYMLEDIIKKKNSSIKLKLGAMESREDEPLAFWADTSKLNSFLK